MKYPPLINAPVRETVFSISYENIVDSNCYDNFSQLENIKKQFPEIKKAADKTFNLSETGISLKSDNVGFDLKNDNEILRIRQGQFSYHFINKYKPFEMILESFSKLWLEFDSVTKDTLKPTSCSVRYINLIELEKEDLPSRLVQIYPKYSSDRNIKGFQNSVRFSYSDRPNHEVNVVSTKLKSDNILIDITVSTLQELTNDTLSINDILIPLQEIKNKAFFDSITARTLLKYLDI
ncbi:MAG: TIGR04255 family protein [Leeuwenhoekiella sp.]